ncbi:uncharacterized protein K02A2.6-like [Gigantopelta aegis]|uniref:uncharacterized protein K02A2.6-like n=1 Tax=Gigantopelta aegis TaxID=1735272 RepID=UPI001B88B271|nr:uncharacterized protein K02A2.6-like [Gigantopelta aegis]
MKALARSYVWWPKMDADIEKLCKLYIGCTNTQIMPNASPVHPWDWPTSPWRRIHIDFAGPFLQLMFLIVVDAHIKWPEIIPMKNTFASQTIIALRNIFARFGLPEQVVSDNGPQFISSEFETFMKRNNIKHITSAPYHPRTNGLAERFVQCFKNAIKHAKNDGNDLNQKLNTFLLQYRNTPYATTGESPSVLMFGRRLRTRLDTLKPDIRKTVQQSQDQMKRSELSVRDFKVGETIMVRDYRNSNKWIPATISRKTGPISYQVDVGRNIWRRHANQIQPIISRKKW